MAANKMEMAIAFFITSSLKYRLEYPLTFNKLRLIVLKWSKAHEKANKCKKIIAADHLSVSVNNIIGFAKAQRIPEKIKMQRD